jgi:hypothetical protein
MSIKPFSDKVIWWIVYDTTHMDDSVRRSSVAEMLHISPSIPPNFDGWIKLMGCPGGVTGSAQRNMALGTIKEGYVYFLDDDNLLHPDLIPKIESMPSIGVNSRAYVFSQQLETRVRKARWEDIRQTHIDTAQYMLDRSLIGDKRFNHHYCADGEFIEELYLDNPQDFTLIEDILSYYNKLRWEK